MQPHQQRVVDDRNELDEKVKKLGVFIGGDSKIFLGLPVEEQERLRRQHSVMTIYSNILAERINAFTEQNAKLAAEAAKY